MYCMCMHERDYITAYKYYFSEWALKKYKSSELKKKYYYFWRKKRENRHSSQELFHETVISPLSNILVVTIKEDPLIVSELGRKKKSAHMVLTV